MTARFPTNRFLLAALAGTALAGCGGGGSKAENSADALRNAADQSSPAAREVLMNEAQRIEEQNLQGPVVQDAMSKAGNAQSGNAAAPVQAQPHKAGDPVPPPKVTPPE